MTAQHTEGSAGTNGAIRLKPEWDIHFETWTDTDVAQGLNLRQTDFPTARQHVTDGLATGFPAGAPFGPSGLIVNCPVVSLDVNISG